ncbi:MAG: hypothetical protein ACK5WS_03115 [Alphaproteobacteria bacterium]|jgi:ankyrin repeat protein
MQPEKQPEANILQNAEEILSNIENADPRDLPTIYRNLLALRDSDGHSLLHIYTSSKNYSKMEYLLSIGANPLYRNKNDKSAITLAIENDDVNALKKLLFALCKQNSVAQLTFGSLLSQTALYLSFPDLPLALHIGISFSALVCGYHVMLDILDSHHQSDIRNI